MGRIHVRILLYLLTMAFHIGNMVYIMGIKREFSNPEVLERVIAFKDLKYRFFTTWTYGLQIAYAMLALGCELVTLKNSHKKDYQLPQILKDFRNIMFSGLLWPTTCLVFTIFWSIFIYDRSLIFPVFLDEIIPPLSNHIMHTAILPIAVLELVFNPRTEPKTHARNVMQLTMHMLVYFSVLYFTFIERGVWLYPVFAKLYGTIYFPISITVIGIMCYIFYCIQWPITKMIHGAKEKDLKKEKVVKDRQNKKNR